MSHLLSFIPACEAYGWAGGPEFKTSITALRNGRERRNAEWSQPTYRFTLPFQNIDQESYSGILNHFLACHGQLHSFLYLNPLDDEATNAMFGLGDGTQTDFQLRAISTVDGVSMERDVTALYVPGANGSAVEADPVVTVDGTPTVVTVDHARGIVIFSAAPSPGAILRWSGKFAHWVRYAQDWLPFSIDNRSGDSYVQNGTVDLLEVPPPLESESGS